MAMEKMSGKDRNDEMLVRVLLNLIEARSNSDGPHSLRIQVVVELILDQLLIKTDKYRITEQDKQLICIAASFHDIGKLAISPEILDKPDRLNAWEFELMKRHTVEGARILEKLPPQGNARLMKFAYQICRWHHERYDGCGYLDGLIGDATPIAAQIAGLADAYDALTSERPYKGAYSHQQALHMIEDGACGEFNPILLECLNECSDSLERQTQAFRNNADYKKELQQTVTELKETLSNRPPNRSRRSRSHDHRGTPKKFRTEHYAHAG
jgi:putative two-component system response regulator